MRRRAQEDAAPRLQRGEKALEQAAGTSCSPCSGRIEAVLRQSLRENRGRGTDATDRRRDARAPRRRLRRARHEREPRGRAPGAGGPRAPGRARVVKTTAHSSAAADPAHRREARQGFRVSFADDDAVPRLHPAGARRGARRGAQGTRWPRSCERAAAGEQAQVEYVYFVASLPSLTPTAAPPLSAHPRPGRRGRRRAARRPRAGPARARRGPPARRVLTGGA